MHGGNQRQLYEGMLSVTTTTWMELGFFYRLGIPSYLAPNQTLATSCRKKQKRELLWHLLEMLMGVTNYNLLLSISTRCLEHDLLRGTCQILVIWGSRGH